MCVRDICIPVQMPKEGKGVQVSMELELYAVVSSSTWVLRIKLSSSARAAGTLDY